MSPSKSSVRFAYNRLLAREACPVLLLAALNLKTHPPLRSPLLETEI